MIKLPKPLSKQENTDLIERVKKTRNREDINRFIEYNARLAVKISHTFKTDEREELESIALLELTKVVNSESFLTHPDVMRLIGKSVYHACLQYLDKKYASPIIYFETDSAVQHDVIPCIETFETLKSICRNKTDTQFLELCLQGHNYSDIAKMLNKPTTTISRIRSTLYERYLNELA